MPFTENRRACARAVHGKPEGLRPCRSQIERCNHFGINLSRAEFRAKESLLAAPSSFVHLLHHRVCRSNQRGGAKLTMAEDLPAFTSWVFGFGGGIFFLGYFLLEIPGSLIVERWSARKWICRIMVTWGIMAAITAFVRTPRSSISFDFFLGVAEAGFFPAFSFTLRTGLRHAIVREPFLIFWWLHRLR